MAVIHPKPTSFKKEMNDLTLSLSTNDCKTQSKELIITPQMFIDDSVQQILLAFHSTVKHEQSRITNVVYVDGGTFFRFIVSKRNFLIPYTLSK